MKYIKCNIYNFSIAFFFLQLYSTPGIDRSRNSKNLSFFQLIVTGKFVFGATSSTCVVHNKTIIYPGVSESGEYLPRRLAAR